MNLTTPSLSCVISYFAMDLVKEIYDLKNIQWSDESNWNGLLFVESQTSKDASNHNLFCHLLNVENLNEHGLACSCSH